MTKLSEITAAPGGAQATDRVYLIRGDGNSPETFEEYSEPVSGLVAASDSGTIYDFGFSFETVPDQGDIFGRVPIMRDIVIPAAFTGSFGKGDTNPDAEVVFDVKDDGVTVFTVTISAAGAVTFDTGSSPAADVEIAAGSVVTAVWPSDSPAEATMAGWAFGLAARVA